MKRLWTVSALVAFVLLAMTVVATPATAQSDIEELVLDAATCGTLGGAWDANTNGCVLENGGEIAEGQLLTIPEGISLWIFASMSLSNNGAIHNLGEIDNDGTFDNYGTILNQGLFANRKGRVVLGTLYNYGTFANPGTIHNDGLIDNRATFTSDSRIEGDGTVLGPINYLTVEELCGKLDTFIGQVNTVTGDLITAEQAALLLDSLAQSKAVLDCP